MSEVIDQLKRDVQEHDVILHGSTKDGDFRPGLISKVMTMETYQRYALYVLSAIAVMVAGQMVMSLLKQTYGTSNGNQNNVSQTISVDPLGDSKPDAYTTEELAKKSGWSVREIQDRAAKGEIPGARKDGREWRFDRTAADAAIAAKTASAATAATNGSP